MLQIPAFAIIHQTEPLLVVSREGLPTQGAGYAARYVAHIRAVSTVYAREVARGLPPRSPWWIYWWPTLSTYAKERHLFKVP